MTTTRAMGTEATRATTMMTRGTGTGMGMRGTTRETMATNHTHTTTTMDDVATEDDNNATPMVNATARQ